MIVGRQLRGVGEHAVADGGGLLDRLDQSMDMLEAVGALDAEALEQAEDDQRGESPCVGGGRLKKWRRRSPG